MEKAFDIRSCTFNPLFDEIQNQLILCIEAIKTGAVDVGTVTATLTVSAERVVEAVPVERNGAFVTELLEHIKPEFDFSAKLALKDKEAQKGKIENDCEVVCVNDGWVLRTLDREKIRKHNDGQLHIDDMGADAEKVEEERKALSKLKKEELLALAEEREITVDEFAPCPQIVETIIAAMMALTATVEKVSGKLQEAEDGPENGK